MQDRMPRSRSWSTVEGEIADLLARIDPAQFETVLALFRRPGRRWFFSGQGRSGLVGQMAAMRFMHAGLDVHVVGEATSPAVRRGDTLVLVCGSGKTPVSVGFARIAKAEGADLVVITREPNSDLAAGADALLTVPAHNSAQFGGSLFEQACLILFDALALEFIGPGEEAQAALWVRHTNLQ